MWNIIKLCSISCLLVITGCASFHVDQQAEFQKHSVIARQYAQKDLHAWTVAGAFSITQNGKQTIASYQWQQLSRNRYKLRIYGPLSMGLVTVSASGNGAQLQRGKKIVYARSAVDLVHKELGWDFPVDNLFYWARGLPVPGGKSMQKFDSFGHLISIKQGSWEIKFSAYKTFAAGIDLPQRLLLLCSGVQIKLVFRNWQFAS